MQEQTQVIFNEFYDENIVKSLGELVARTLAKRNALICVQRLKRQATVFEDQYEFECWVEVEKELNSLK